MRRIRSLHVANSNIFGDLILKTLWGPFGDPFSLFLEKRQCNRSEREGQIPLKACDWKARKRADLSRNETWKSWKSKGMCDNFQGHPSSKSLSRPAVKNSPLLKWKYHPFVQNTRERERESRCSRKTWFQIEFLLQKQHFRVKKGGYISSSSYSGKFAWNISTGGAFVVIREPFKNVLADFVR